MRSRACDVKMTQRQIITDLTSHLKEKYGDEYILHGSDESEGIGFRIKSIATSFSALSFGDILENKSNFQVESFPPGDYMFTGEITLKKFTNLIELFRAPQDE